jgi:tRNA threonylcarbamoyladenosine biosynthesis protein TsaB
MLLAFNTCGSTATVALGLAEPDLHQVRIVATASLAARTYSARLVPEIATLLHSQHATLSDIECIVVVNGPGSFTGIRVGLSTAKGLAEGGGIPLIAVSRLALLAAASGLPHVLAAVDAGRGEYYVGEYREGNKLGEVLLSGDETVAAAKQPGAGVLVCDESRAGDVPEAATSVCSALAICGPVYVQPPDAADALHFALDRFRAHAFDDVESLQANYLRRSDAEVLRSVRAAVPAGSKVNAT